MSNSRGPSRTVSKELDRAKPSRTSSLRSDISVQKGQVTGYKFKQKVLTTTLSIDEEDLTSGAQKGSPLPKGSDVTKNVEATKKVPTTQIKSARGGKSPSESGRGSRQITLIDDGQPPKSKAPYRRSVSTGDSLEEDPESSTPRSGRFLKRTRSLISSPSINSASSKSTPTRVASKKGNSAAKTIKDYLTPKEPVQEDKEEQISQKIDQVNGDVKAIPQAKIAYIKAKDVISWLGDSNRDTPLALQLGHNGEYYTNTKGNNNWTKSSSVTPDNILQELDFWVCKNREAHIINLSEEGDQRGQNYSCPSCSGKQIKVTQTTHQDCTLYVHDIDGFTISRIKTKETNYTGLSNIGGVKSVNVYCTKNTVDAFLIYFKYEDLKSRKNENRWYSRCSGDTHWEVEKGFTGVPSVDDITSMKSLLTDSLTPMVIVNLSIDRESKEFRLKDVEYDGKLLDIKSDVSMKNLIAYYYSSDGIRNLLLLVEMRLNGNSRSLDGEKWISVARNGNTKVDVKKLENVVALLKRIEFPEPPSNTGKIIETSLITSDVLAGGAAVGLGIWKGPALLARLITRKYGGITHLQDDDGERLNEEYRFKRSKRTYHKLQESIMGLMTKYKSDLEHLDDKIKSLESQFFNNPPEATGLIKGWEGNVLNNAYASLSNGLKSRRGLHNKLKANFVQTQTVITEHIFSLTSSTCSISRMLLNNS
ncbi:hypothetical protein BEWA_054560 [Theileria equi strain WA]|uniref:Uncharacterized protein n=1 Tax=Theileria equi strain WA TaxID=1537102 RepID=L1LDS7_THEEQ|nr:hypothetical protein BEWA_054560 [Theileria equi strain WA]EKX73400.1 hypothetical protein BEWA_054560 [Theileria equi strain WA]|eukprot:XP_004832852.1 hypothetical protein BEWA_054560 [Theileria equi strain WA]